MSIIIKSGSSGNTATVSAAGELAVGLPANPLTAGYAKITSSSGAPMNISDTGYVFTGQDNLLFVDQVDGNALNTTLWNSAVTTMTITQASGTINLNASTITTVSTAAQINSVKQISTTGAHPICVTFTAITNVGAQANAVREMGVGAATGTSAPTDGAFFRWASSGDLLAVINNGGIETTSVITPQPSDDVAHQYIVYIDNDRVLFLIDMMPVATIYRPAGQPFPLGSTRLPIFARVYTLGTTPATAPKLSIGQTIAVQCLLNQNRSWYDTIAAMGRGSFQAPLTAFAQTANHTNSAAPASATLSNTAAGYSTLGGKFQFAAAAGAATDFALFAYQVPNGYQLRITNVAIRAMNTGAANATTPTILDWALGVNSSGVSLATADSAGVTWAPRRIPLGMQSLTTTAAIGESATPNIDVAFGTPIFVDANRYLHVILSIPVGTATASQIIRGAVMINGCFE